MSKLILRPLLLAAPLLYSGIATGATRSVEEARDVAAKFFHEEGISRLADTNNLITEHIQTAGNTPSYFVFTASDGEGFIIVSADDSEIPVLGYSSSSPWSHTDVPEEALNLIGRAKTLNLRAAEKSSVYRASAQKKVLNTATWSQDAPFNNKIPNRHLVGCVGTALAEILQYHQYPTVRPASLVKDGEPSEYDRANIRLDNYRSGYSATEADAVATLVADAAFAIGTDFGMSSSSAFEVRVPAALVNLFGYDAGVSYKKGAEMNRNDWEDLIISEIDAGRPVLYCGQDMSAGHAFVCDGYELHDTTPFLHINWGWGGAADGFYASDALNPTVSTSHSFNDLTTIVYNIKPAERNIEWSPIHITSDEKQVGMTMDVENLNPGTSFTLRAGALKNICNDDFSGNVSAALFSSDGRLKLPLGEGKRLSLPSLQILGYTDLDFTIPSDASIEDDDVVRLVTRENESQAWLPVANDLLTLGEASAKGYAIPYFNIIAPEDLEGADISYPDSRVIKGRDFSFTVAAASPELVVTVKANGFILTPDIAGRYIIKNVNADQEVTVIVQNVADVVSRRTLWVNAGQLQDILSDIDAGTISDLTLFGTVNASDFTFMRERMKLTRLDLSGTSITAQGANPANAIPAKAFSGYGSLSQIILPNNVTTFKSGCFNATGLTSIEIPASVATYEYNIFLNCRSLREVTVRRSSPAWVNWCVFSGSPKSRLVVPLGAAESYREKDNWKDFTEIVEEEAPVVNECLVLVQETEGVKITPMTESTLVTPGTDYSFCAETEDSFGDATLKVYANGLLLHSDRHGVYHAQINSNTLIHTAFNYPTEMGDNSPWKITSSAGGIGIVSEVVNVIQGKSFTIRANAIAIPSGDDAALFYCAALTDKDGRLKELISPIVANSYYNHGNLPATFTCQVKEADVREGNRVCIVSSYDKKNWSMVMADSDSVADYIDAIGNRVTYHDINMPQSVAGAVISGGVSKVVRGMPFSMKVTPVAASDRITIAVNGVNKIVDAAVANLSVPAVLEDMEIAIQVVAQGEDSYNVVNVREGELSEKLAVCPSRLKVVGTMRSEDFDAFREHASEISALDLADVTIKGAGDLSNAIPSNAFASPVSGAPTALSTIILPSGLVNIEANAFNRCVSLTEVTIPASVAYIGSNAFTSCVNLKKIVCLGTQPAATGNMNPFPTHTGITLEVPKGAENDYGSATYWKDLAVSASATYFNIQIDPSRVFSYNGLYDDLTKILYTGSTLQVTLGMPNFKPTGYKSNPNYRPGVAFKVFDNNEDKTYTFSMLYYGQYPVYFDDSYGFESVRYPKNHVIDVVFFYGLNFNLPDGLEREFVDLGADEVWENVRYDLFVEDSSLRPTLYREGRDFKFKFSADISRVELHVMARSKVMTQSGPEPVYTTIEEVLMPDDNGVYTLANLQGDTDITVTTSLLIEDGAVVSSDELALVDAADAANISSLGLSGEINSNGFNLLRGKFGNLETLDMSEMDNEEIPDGAFEGMDNLTSVTVSEHATSIGKNAFAGCAALESITLPSVENIGAGAFDGCASLTSISVLRNSGNHNLMQRPRRNGSENGGISDDSFLGINHNCLIYLPEGLQHALKGTPNVIVDNNGARTAAADIVLTDGYPFNAPASFSLGDNSISMEVNIPGSISDVNDGWRGFVLPFTPTDYIFAKEFTPRCDSPLTLLSFSGDNGEALMPEARIEANRPYLASVYAPFDTVPVVFVAKGMASPDNLAYDVPFTPSPEEIVAAGNKFSLYGCYGKDIVEGNISILDDNGIAFRSVSDDMRPQPFSVYVAGDESPEESFNIGLHPLWVMNPVSSRENDDVLYRSKFIELSSPTAEAEIFYTTDGTDPLSEGKVYTGPFNPTEDGMTLKAVARCKGWDSDITTATYHLHKTSIDYAMVKGWNWISHNVETPVPTDSVLGINVESVMSQTQEANRESEDGFSGSIPSLNPLECYKVFATDDASSTVVNGIAFDPSSTVCLREGANWIGCPMEADSMSIDDLFANLDSSEGETIAGQSGFSQVDSKGNWIGTLNTLRLGEGYIFFSNTEHEFVYNTSASSADDSSPETETATAVPNMGTETGWQVNNSKYPSVMPVVSNITNYDGSIPEENYDVAAFCNDECRGVGTVVDGHIFISVYGKEGDEIRFRLHSTDTGKDIQVADGVAFEEQPLGSLHEPYILRMPDDSGVNAIHSENLDITAGNGRLIVDCKTHSYSRIEVFTEAGLLIGSSDSFLQLYGLAAGVYFVVVADNNHSVSHKVMVD